MVPRKVVCEKCGSEATLKRVEGQLILSDPSERSSVILIIDCPECGEREQRESPSPPKK